MKRMGIIHEKHVLRLRIGSNMLSSPSRATEIEVSKYNAVKRGILERKMKQKKYIYCLRGDRKTIRKRCKSRLRTN
jgi:hypothetical protein